MTLAGTLYVFSNHLCFGARFFDADVRRVSTMHGLKVFFVLVLVFIFIVPTNIVFLFLLI